MRNWTRIAALASLPLWAVAAQPPPSGLWDATVVVNQVEIPFRFELSLDQRPVSGAFFNGDEKVRSTNGSFENGVLTLRFDHYATQLEARWDEGRWTGTYSRGTRSRYAFRAVPHVASAQATAEKAPSIAGEWEIAVKSPKGESAWRFLVRQSGNDVSGAILRVDGDTGTLSGSYRDGKFLLSHFSGARPGLWEVKLTPEGTLELVQNGKEHYTARRPVDARSAGLVAPVDPAHHTGVKDPNERFHFSAPDLTGKLVSDSDPRFQGKVVIVSVSGSWCPNCHDEAPFLAELYRTYRERGLEIVTLSFEEADQLQDPTRLRAFIQQYGIEYPVLLGGEPAQVHDKLPQAVNLNTWPATFFLGRDGKVRATHAGFASRASGAAHTELRAEITRTVEELLSEKAVLSSR